MSLSSSPRQGSGPYLPTLDGWRAIAIGLVMAQHGMDSFAAVAGERIHSLLETILKTHGGGILGVKIFFAISGYLITSRLLHDEETSGSISLRSFYLRRAFRILPASLCFTSVVGLLGVIGILPIPLFCWASAVLCFINYQQRAHTWYLGHFWSLAIEEHFYFLWPSFLALAPRHRRIAIAVTLAYLVGIWRAVAFKFHLTYTTSEAFWARTDIQIDGLLWGSILALALTVPRYRSLLVKATSPAAWWGWVALLGASLAVSPFLNWKLRYALLSVYPIVIAFMVVGTTLHPETVVGRVLESAVFRWVGRISYSLYLWQQLFLVFRESQVPAMELLQRWPINIAAALGCATASYYLIERPLIRVGHRLAAGLGAPPVVVRQPT
jgi:peptidoglycan/LPS O-acetylase OafA/YrhL